MRSRRKLVASATCALTAVLATPAVAGARDLPTRPWQSVFDGRTSAVAQLKGQDRASFSAREDPPSDSTGLSAARENFEVVSSLNPQKFGGVRPGEIADLAVHEGYAYLNSWDNEFCDRGGVYVVDIKNPASPREVGYIEPVAPFYHGEGAHAISVNVPGFDGDVLAVNNETFGSNVLNECGPDDASGGGFDLYDVTDPTNPKPLVQGAGDRDNGTPDDPSDDTPTGNSYHSVFVWDAGENAYLVASDNIEREDVDIWDITDPTRPTQVADVDLSSRFPQILEGEQGNGGNVFNHDMDVKRIDGRWMMTVSNWDAGYVQLDVTNPADPKYVTDTTFGTDPLRPSLTAEGNAHQSTYSFDNQFILAADEDFATVRTTAVEVTSGPNAGDVVGIAGADSVPVYTATTDDEANGPTRFVGTACDGEPIPAPPAVTGNQDAIAVIERGVCGGGFAEKIENVENAGYDAAIVFNQAGRPDADPLVSMTTGGAQIPAVFVRRATAVGTATGDGALFPGRAGATPPVGTAGEGFRFADAFDGWGYTHLYDARTSELIDSYAVKESQDPRYASGFGDLSVHEWAADPTEPIAYSAYYGAGMRAATFSRSEGITETAKYIADDANGSNFWGVEVFTAGDGERYIAGSDRDFGLQIFRYTGPGAPKRPVCTDTAATTRAGTAVAVPLTCTDANTGNTLTRRIVSGPGRGTVSQSGDTATYTPAAGFSGTDSFTFLANDGAADSAPATARVTVPAPATGPGPGSGPARPSDRFSITFRSRQQIATVRRRGLLLGVRCGTRCSLRLDIVVSAATQRRYGLASRRIGSRRATLTRAGFRRYRVVLSRSASRRLAGVRTLNGTLRVTRTSPAPRRTISRSFRLRLTNR